MADFDPHHGHGPVFRTLTEISKLPREEQFAALLERLDRLDVDEREKIGVAKSGREYSMTSNTIRLSILEVGKKWIEERGEDASAAKSGKLAGLGVFRKAG